MSGRERRRLYRSRPWRRVRAFVLDAALWRCERCGARGRLEVHHRRPLADGGAPFDPANLEAVCRRCHFKVEPGRHQAPGAGWLEAIDAGA